MLGLRALSLRASLGVNLGASLGAALALLVSSAAWALQQSAYGNFRAESLVSFLASPDSDLTRPQGTDWVQSFGYAADGWRRHWGLDASLSFAKPDYSHVELSGPRGEMFLLSSDPRLVPIESSGALELRWLGENDSLSLLLVNPLSYSPYAARSQSLSYLRNFFGASSRVGAKLSTFELAQPESYFTDLDFRRRERPRRVHAFESAFNFEQSLSEVFKVAAELSLGERIEDRPPYWGLELKQAYALSDRLFAKAHAGLRREMKNTSLKNERGYFSRALTGVELSVEPAYETLLSLAYDLQVESESDPRRQSYTRLGSDQYGLSLRSRVASSWQYEIGAALRLASDKSRSWSAMGSLRWEL
jgi:hypothetical protein